MPWSIIARAPSPVPDGAITSLTAAGVQERQDADRIGVGDASQGADAGRVGGPGDVAGALGVDAAVLAVDDHEVEARATEELDQLERVGDLLQERSDHRLAGGDLLA